MLAEDSIQWPHLLSAAFGLKRNADEAARGERVDREMFFLVSSLILAGDTTKEYIFRV